MRTSATYECVSYAADGELRRSREVATAHGTAFGYRRQGDATLLLTNAHVADWPAVTERSHPVDGVPAGCKRVAESLKIVDDDHDRYAADDLPLTRVISDPQLDVAILRAPAKLQILPWKIGHSSALTARAVVEVKGFPLGQFQATNVGKVISAFDHDDQGEWNHDDFVVDALLSAGGSGSPVLAVSCRTGEFELVGIFHAHYSEGSALNVVVAIDQVQSLMTTLQRSPLPPVLAGAALDADARARLTAATQTDQAVYFPFGPLVASVHAQANGGLVFLMFPADFPRSTHPLFGVEDLHAADGFGKVGAVYLGDAQGLRAYNLAAADADIEALVERTIDALRRNAVTMLDYRAAAASAQQSRLASAAMERQRRALDRMLDGQHDDAQSMVELASRVAPLPTSRPADLAATRGGESPADVPRPVSAHVPAP